MENHGNLSIHIHSTPEWAHIDIKDSGKGIDPKKLKAIFQPGFSTKKRGWGLGLSLAKRIVKNYHKGSIYVLSSTAGEGTIFRIALRK
jgi:signal transduction histidine kinase